MTMDICKHGNPTGIHTASHAGGSAMRVSTCGDCYQETADETQALANKRQFLESASIDILCSLIASGQTLAAEEIVALGVKLHDEIGKQVGG